MKNHAMHRKGQLIYQLSFFLGKFKKGESAFLEGHTRKALMVDNAQTPTFAV